MTGDQDGQMSGLEPERTNEVQPAARKFTDKHTENLLGGNNLDKGFMNDRSTKNDGGFKKSGLGKNGFGNSSFNSNGFNRRKAPSRR